MIDVGDGTWTETQPDNLQFVYDTSGNLSRMVSPAGGRWTVVRSSGLMTALAGPLSRRTTFAPSAARRSTSTERLLRLSAACSAESSPRPAARGAWDRPRAAPRS